MSEALFFNTINALTAASKKILTLNDDEVFDRIQAQKATLAEAFSILHTRLIQLEQTFANAEFVFDNGTVENDILDYVDLLKEYEEPLAEKADYILSGGLNNTAKDYRALHLKEVLEAINECCQSIGEIL